MRALEAAAHLILPQTITATCARKLIFHKATPRTFPLVTLKGAVSGCDTHHRTLFSHCLGVPTSFGVVVDDDDCNVDENDAYNDGGGNNDGADDDNDHVDDGLHYYLMIFFVIMILLTTAIVLIINYDDDAAAAVDDDDGNDNDVDVENCNVVSSVSNTSTCKTKH